ncbi:MAG TPA: hypothetical protein VNF49_03720 [Candidatus Binataceae bacterium]|nr:hypothetical protein [Candidatus Binataceae bacterium]
MTLGTILGYCFLFGLMHGILPDEHTWPITFSYAIGGGSGAQGMRAGIYFSAAFTVQRMLISELSYLALAPILRSAAVNAAVYVVVGVAMSLAGWLLLRRQRYVHLHLLGHHHETPREMDTSTAILTRRHAGCAPGAGLPLRWTLIHGFIAGFGFGGFALFVNAVAAPAMPSAWLGFVPGLLYGAGTIVTHAAVSTAFALGLRFAGGLDEAGAQRLGARVGATTLFFGGFLFAAGGIAMAAGAARYLPVGTGYMVIALFVVAVVVPAFVHAWRELPAVSKPPPANEVEYSRDSLP